MTTISTEINEFVLTFKKTQGEDAPRKPIFLPRLVAESMSKQLNNKEVKSIERRDENGDFLEMIDKYDIKNIRKITPETMKGLQGDKEMDRYCVCEYGGRHKHLGKEGWEECECKEYFGVPPFIFQKLVRKQFPNVDYDSDVTPKMRAVMKELLGKS